MSSDGVYQGDEIEYEHISILSRCILSAEGVEGIPRQPRNKAAVKAAKAATQAAPTGQPHQRQKAAPEAAEEHLLGNFSTQVNLVID